MTMVLTIFIKYVLHSIDLQSENPWDNKAVYMLYTELFTGNLPSLSPMGVGRAVGGGQVGASAWGFLEAGISARLFERP